MSSTMSFSEASCAMALQSLHATRALAMASSPCCQKNSAIFCRFMSTAHTMSSWKGNGKWLISGSSRSMSTSSSRLRVVFWRPLRMGMSSWSRAELLQPGEREEAVHADSILDQQLDEVHPVQHQGVQHGLLQGAHLRGGDRHRAQTGAVNTSRHIAVA
ncbi:hypothetical protein EYF80_051085 [Liparis tanakae]|uniref:Uncharacterized protein n=1 Tax=Liparis tanakae TaxID=230148 RepID=A0A4Z2FD93_9TELE|nr:hypothetical protein EYF80_051085 [Liparis tanakae]